MVRACIHSWGPLDLRPTSICELRLAVCHLLGDLAHAAVVRMAFYIIVIPSAMETKEAQAASSFSFRLFRLSRDSIGENRESGPSESTTCIQQRERDRLNRTFRLTRCSSKFPPSLGAGRLQLFNQCFIYRSPAHLRYYAHGKPPCRRAVTPSGFSTVAAIGGFRQPTARMRKRSRLLGKKSLDSSFLTLPTQISKGWPFPTITRFTTYNTTPNVIFLTSSAE